MLPDTEWRMWRQLKNFGINKFIFVPIAPGFEQIDIEQYATMEEALAAATGNKVFLEANGEKGMTDLPPRDEDVVFVLGNTTMHNQAHTTPADSHSIKEPMETSMYPTCAAAIALAFWHGQ